MFLFQQITTSVKPGDLFKSEADKFLQQVQAIADSLPKVKANDFNKQFLADYKGALSSIQKNLKGIDPSKITDANKQDYYKLLAGYKLLLTTYEIGQKYLDELNKNGGEAFLKNKRNVEASIKAIRKTLVPNIVSSLEGVLGGKTVQLNADDVQAAVSNFVIISKAYGEAKDIMGQDGTNASLKFLGVHEEPSGSYFFERPKGRYFGDAWS